MRHAWLGLIALTLITGCGPTELESGQSLLLAAPLITLCGMLLQIGYVRLWRLLYPNLEVAHRPAGIAAAAPLGLLLVSVIARGPTDVLEWSVFALVLVGTSYLTLLCLVLSFLIRPRLQRYLPFAPIMPWLILGPPAVYYALAGSATAEPAGWVVAAWILPGYGGYATMGALVLVFTEVLIQRRRHKLRNQPPPEPIFPTARVVKDGER